MAVYRKDKERAIAEGLVRIEGNKVKLLDAKPILWDGTDNTDYGKELKGKSLQRVIYAYSDIAPLIKIKLYREECEKVKVVPMLKKVQFLGKSSYSGKESEVVYQLASDKFEVVGEAENIKQNLLSSPLFVPFKDIPEYTKREVISTADVVNIQFLKRGNSLILGDFNADHTVRLNLNKGIPITFGRDSKVIFGTRISDKFPNINRYGSSGFSVWAIPEFIVPPSVQTPLVDTSKVVSPPPPPDAPLVVPARTTSSPPIVEDGDKELSKSIREQLKLRKKD